MTCCKRSRQLSRVFISFCSQLGEQVGKVFGCLASLGKAVIEGVFKAK